VLDWKSDYGEVEDNKCSRNNRRELCASIVSFVSNCSGHKGHQEDTTDTREKQDATSRHHHF